MVDLDMYEYNMVAFTMFLGQIMPIMSSYDSESELELSTWIDAFFDFFFIDSRKSFTNTLGGTMSSERKAISELLHRLEGKDQGCGGVRCGGGGGVVGLSPLYMDKRVHQ